MNHHDQDHSHSRTGTPSRKPVHPVGAGPGTAGDSRLCRAWAQPAFNRQGTQNQPPPCDIDMLSASVCFMVKS